MYRINTMKFFEIFMQVGNYQKNNPNKKTIRAY